ncbi:transposase [Paenibacillus pabuli]|uniref:transposase n=1 Tax=Paenibacillus pabuli TaxID=1472 RepID=UPI003CFB65E6
MNQSSQKNSDRFIAALKQSKVLRLMQALGIRSRIRSKHRCNYASSTEGRIAKNLLKRDFKADRANQKWVTDVTQFRVGESWIYLSAVKDLFNNEIVAYHMSQRNDNRLVLQTFENAFNKTKDVTGLIVHSDQGFQYTSYPYRNMDEAQRRIEAYIHFYTQHRPQRKLNKLPPVGFRKQFIA